MEQLQRMTTAQDEIASFAARVQNIGETDYGTQAGGEAYSVPSTKPNPNAQIEILKQIPQIYAKHGLMEKAEEWNSKRVDQSIKLAGLAKMFVDSKNTALKQVGIGHFFDALNLMSDSLGLTSTSLAEYRQKAIAGGDETANIYTKMINEVFDVVKRAQDPKSGISMSDVRPAVMSTIKKYKDLLDEGDTNKVLEEVEKELASIEKTKTEKLVNMPPWYDSMGVEKLGQRYHTPEGQKEFADYLATPQGTVEASAYRRQFASETAMPFYNVVPTAEGYTPFNARTGAPGQPTEFKKPVPSEQMSRLSDLETLVENNNRIDRLYKADYVGPIAGRLGGIKEQLVELPSQQVEFYSYVRDQKDALLRARSGAQINEQEYKRLVKFLPDENLPPANFKARAKRFTDEVKLILSNKRKELSAGGFGPSQTPSPAQEPARPTGSKFKILKVE